MRKLNKKFLALLLVAVLAFGTVMSAVASDSLVGSGWWTDTQTSTAQTLEDGATVTFSVAVTSDTLEDGDYAAFCVEATDGTNYFTGTSDGDCWGAGTDTDGTSTGVVVGGSYTVTITRDGNNFTADIIDDATEASILANSMYLEGTSDFGDTTCYIMSQVGDLTVDVVEEEEVVEVVEELVGSDWWTDCQTSTAIALEDGATVSFTVEISSDSIDEGGYAAFCVEATDGTNYFTGTSDGDCWGAGTDTDGTSTGAVVGGSYTVTITRDGNNFTADIVDNSTGESILANPMYLEGTSDFGDTTCYIMTQVGNLTVTYTSSSASDDEDETTTTEISEDEAPTTETSEDETTTTAAEDETTTTAAEDETTTTAAEDETTTTAASEDETTTTATAEDETTTTTTSEDVNSNQIVVTTTTTVTEQTGTTTEIQEVEATESGTADDVTIEGGFSEHTGEVTISGDFDLTYYFTNTGDLEDSDENWNNFILEIHTGGTVTNADGEEVMVYIDVRSDNYGWLAFNTDGAELTFGDGADDWATWLALMESGTEVTVNVVRSGNTFTINWIMGKGDYYFTASVTAEDFEGQDAVVYLTGEQCTLSSVSYTYTYTTTEEVEVPVYSTTTTTTTTTYDIADQVDVAIDSAELTATNTDADVEVGVESYELSEDELTALAEIYGGTLTNVYDVYLTYAGTDDVYTLQDGESVQIKFNVSSESVYANVLLLHYVEAGGAWEVITPDEIGDGYILATFTSLSPVAIIAGTITESTNTSSTVEEESTTAAEEESTTVSTATSTDGDGDETTTVKAAEAMGDVTTWMYVVLLAGAAAVCVALAKKRVTE